MQKNMKKPVLRIRIYQYPDPGSKKCPYGPGSYGIKQCCGAGAASFRAAPELEPIFFWSELGAGAGVLFLMRLQLRLHLLGKQKRKAWFLCQT